MSLVVGYCGVLLVCACAFVLICLGFVWQLVIVLRYVWCFVFVVCLWVVCFGELLIVWLVFALSLFNFVWVCYLLLCACLMFCWIGLLWV